MLQEVADGAANQLTHTLVLLVGRLFQNEELSGGEEQKQFRNFGSVVIVPCSFLLRHVRANSLTLGVVYSWLDMS